MNRVSVPDALRATPTNKVDHDVAHRDDDKGRPGSRNSQNRAGHERREDGQRQQRAMGQEPVGETIHPT